MYVRLYVCMYVCMYVCVCVCVCMYVCVYVCMYVCIRKHKIIFIGQNETKYNRISSLVLLQLRLILRNPGKIKPKDTFKNHLKTRNQIKERRKF